MAIEKINPEGEINQFPYMEIFIVVLLIQLIFDNFLNMRQIKVLQKKDFPPILQELNITESQYRKSQDYSLDKIGFEMLSSCVKVFIEITLTLTYVYPFLWKASSRLCSFVDSNSDYQRGLVFLLLEYIRSKVIDIPFSLYHSFIIEERHGFNKKTFRLFLKDEILGFLISLILVPIVLFVYIYLVENGGQYFYIYVEAFLIVFIFIMMWIYPNLIAPLFNKFEELEKDNKDLKQAIDELAFSIKFPLKKIYVMDGSIRSAHSNAYFYGFGSNKRIVLFDTLLKQLNQNEIVSVMGHELGHWKMNHITKNLILIIAKTLVYMYIFGFFLNEKGLFASYGFDEKSIFIGTLLYANLINPVSYFLSILSLKVSRYFEFQADEFACKLGKGLHLRSSLVKLVTENSSTLISDPLYAACNYSHPTLIERYCFITQQIKKLYPEKENLIKPEEEKAKEEISKKEE